MKIIKKNPIWLVALFIMLVSTVYWSVVVTERYVSKAHVVLQTPDIAPPEISFSSMMSGGAASNTADLLYLRDYLLSPDVLKLLDKELNLKQHFTQSNIDWVSRMDADLPLEFFHDYYLKRVSVEMDSYSNVLVIQAQAFDSLTAHKVVSLLIQFGEKHMNQMGQRLASEQVGFIEKQVEQLAQRLEQSQQAVLAYQDKEGLMSPEKTAESINTLVAGLYQELSKLKANKAVLSQYQSSRSPDIIKLTNEIKVLESQINKEKMQLTDVQGKALNKVTADYQALLLKAQFAQEMYANALATLEATRVEAARKLKQVSVLQSASVPEYPIEPNRLYNITVTIILVTLISIILSLFMTIIRDHKD
ncbi:MAG: chain-length determining protein [Pseudomonadota bacterium]|nr:chain-length determining protein [Pseudomonadota bacterium]